MSDSNAMKKIVSPEEFVTTWQTSTSTAEVARKLGISLQSAISRSGNYRKKGVPLKRFGQVYKCNYDALADLAKKLSQDKPE